MSDLRVFQWPAGQPAWLADPASFDPKKVRDYVSIVVQSNGGFDETAAMVGLVVDEWHEVVPNETETTGVTFHYDAPNAEPPQTLLLAVPTRRRDMKGTWTWNDLVNCVDHALLLGKMRAVGPDELRGSDLDLVLPTTLAAETVTPATVALSYLINISDRINLDQSNIWSKL